MKGRLKIHDKSNCFLEVISFFFSFALLVLFLLMQYFYSLRQYSNAGKPRLQDRGSHCTRSPFQGLFLKQAMPMVCVTQHEVCAHCIQLPEVVSVVDRRGQRLKTGAATSVAYLSCSTSVKPTSRSLSGKKIYEK